MGAAMALHCQVSWSES